MKYSLIALGTLKVAAFEMIMGVPEDMIRARYKLDEEDNMRIGMNGLIVETEGRIVLFDPGCATFLSKSLAEIYDLEMELSLSEEVKKAGYAMEDITDVLFTHLHFDHGSGAFKRVIGGIEKAFPNARYVVSRKQLEYVQTLSPEDGSSFFHKLLRFAGELSYLEEWNVKGIRFHSSHGHTPFLAVPVIDAGDHDLLYATDLIPMILHQGRGAWSYYDDNKELLEQERSEVLSSLREGSEVLYYHEVL